LQKQKEKSKLFLLSPGPNFNLEFSLRNRCENLSKNSCGLVLTSGPKYQKVKYGNFTVICIKDPLEKSLISSLGFLVVGFYQLLQAKLTGDKFNLFVTYDPLKTGLIGVLLTSLTGTKMLVEINGDYTQDVIYSEIKNVRKRKIKKWLMITIERFVLNHVDAIKLLHDKQIDFFKPLKRDVKIGRFPDFVNTHSFRNLGETKEVLFVGFPFMVKGVDILIEAFKKVSDNHEGWKLKILGWYPDMTLLDRYIDNHPNIYHHPPVDRSEVAEHMGKCGIFVLPSRTEAMGRVLIEAMASEKPRIGANVGGIPTVIDKDVDGLLFESENINELASLLDSLMADKNRRQELGKKARERYEVTFTPEKYFEQLNNFYKEILAE